MKSLKFSILDGNFTVHRLQMGANIPKSVYKSPFFSITGTEDELSIVANENILIENGKSEPGWAVLKVIGPLDFSETGILAGIASTLAAAEISIFAVSTFETDYILVKREKLKAAKEALGAAGHKFARASKSKPTEPEPQGGFLQDGYQALLEKNLPAIRQLLSDKIGPGVLATLTSPTAISMTVGSIYEFLPTAVRLVVPRQAFVDFCVMNIDKLRPEPSKPKAKK